MQDTRMVSVAGVLLFLSITLGCGDRPAAAPAPTIAPAESAPPPVASISTSTAAVLPREAPPAPTATGTATVSPTAVPPTPTGTATPVPSTTASLPLSPPPDPAAAPGGNGASSGPVKDLANIRIRKGGPIQNTILCYYGNRVAKTMGVLGQFSLDQLAAKLRDLGKVYGELNGGRGVTPCFDYIYLVANASAPPYAHYTPALDLFEEAMQFAEDKGLLFFVDLQLGYRSLEEEIAKVLPYLRKPNVHLALDTEFFMHRRGGVPGDTLGSMDAADVNRAQDLMQRYITEHRLPDKILKVYQFDPIMLTNKDQLNLHVPNVHLLINADGVGYGGKGGKLHDYQEYAGEPHNALGIKLFLDWDTPLLQPQEVMALNPPPDEVVYQ